jgi:hypothetical protein
MKLIRYVAYALLGLLGLILLFLAVSLVPASSVPYLQTDAYLQTLKNVDSLRRTLPALPAAAPDSTPARAAVPKLKAGWAKVALTPAQATPTGGYGVRNGQPYLSIHDSVFVRAIVLDNGATRVAVVSADLLLIPPTVTAQLREKLPAIGFTLQQTYLGATHTHNSLGGWGERLAGRIFAGKFNPATVTWITDRIVEAIATAQRRLVPAETGYAQIYQADMVHNRLVGDEGTIDPFVRLLKIRKITGETALLCTYAAHSTTIEPNLVVLSRDWPGALVDSLERQKTVNFAQYMAGAVGSMAPLEEGKTDWEQLRNEALGLQLEIQRVVRQVPLRADSTLRLVTLPLALREPQWRVLGNLKMRHWLWRKVYGDYPADLKALRVGNTLLLGAPCDFSGELVADLSAEAQQRGLNLMITSFNGSYIGYVTPDKYWSRDSYETYTMNWYGPGTASFFGYFMGKLIRLLS